MMSIISNIFLDSSVIIEPLKGRETDFYKYILKDNSLVCFINEVVISEYSFHALSLYGGASPLTLKGRKAISSILSEHSNKFHIFQDFEFLPSSKEMVQTALTFMETYNMLPNDAMILATCKINNILMLASHDKDFILPCENENIKLITTNNYRDILPVA